MKKLAAVLAAMMVFSAAQASPKVVTVYGWVTDMPQGTSPLIKVGDEVTIHVRYDASNNAVNRVTVMVNESELNLARASDGSHVYIDNNPLPDDPATGRGFVQWSFEGNACRFDVATNTFQGVFPCIDDYDNGRNFQIFFNGVIANGPAQAQPHVRTGN